MSRRTRPFRVCGSCGLFSVSGRPPGRPYEYTLSMFTKRAPFPSAAANTLRCSGGKSSAQRWYSGFSVWYTDAAPCAARVANAASVHLARRQIDIAERLRIAAERLATTPVDDAHGEAAADECDGGGTADGAGAEHDVHVAGHARPFVMPRAESSRRGTGGRYRGEHP